MDEIKMMASHGQEDNDPPLSPDEAKAIWAHYGSKLPEGFWDNLTGPERETLLNASETKAGVPGLSPGLLNGAMSGMSGLLKYTPLLRKAAGALGMGAGAAAGGAAAQKTGEYLDLPHWLTNALSMGAMMAGGGAGAKLGAGKILPPEVVAEETAATSKLPEAWQKALAEGRSIKGTGKTPGEWAAAWEKRENMLNPKAPKTAEDVLENSFNMHVENPRISYDKTALGYPNLEKLGRQEFNAVGKPVEASLTSKSAKFSETDKGAKDLEELLDRLHGPNRGNNPNGGSRSLGGPDTAGLRAQPNVTAKRTYGDVAEATRKGVSVEGHTMDPFNDDGQLDEERLKRLFKDLDQKKNVKLRRR